MPLRIWLRIAVFAVAAALSLTIASAWRAQQRDRSQLAQDLATTRQALAEATSRQQQRDSDLRALLGKLDEQKRTVTTPAQIVRALPQGLHLPAPLVLSSPKTDPHTPDEQNKPPTGQDGLATAPQPQVILPTQDLKPLYDYSVDCAECQARLLALQGNLADEQTKTAAVSRERDSALRFARGGSIWRRVAHSAKWFALGAVVGAVAAKAAH